MTLTGLSSQQTMPWMVRLSRACASLLVVVGVLTSAWATCVEGATASPMQQMACCKAGHHHCPMKDSAADCCAQSGPQVESQGTIVKAVSFSAPVPTPITLAWVILPIRHIDRSLSASRVVRFVPSRTSLRSAGVHRVLSPPDLNPI